MNSTIERTGKIVLVTGPAGNLGSAVVEKFAREGDSLILFDRHPQRIKTQFPALAASDDHLLITNVDLMEAEAVRLAVDSALESRGRIDCLIHTAGGFQMGEGVHEISAENFELMLDINVRTLLNITRSVIPGMIEQKDGMIITIGARPALKGKKKMGSYSVAKAAVLRLTESIAAEGQSTGISARCIIPGTIDTPQNRQAMPGANTSGWIKPTHLAEIIYQVSANTYHNDEDVIIRVKSES